MQNKKKILEVFRYLIVGVLTTLVSLAVYYGLVYTVLNPENALELQIANIISWIVSVIFAYIANRVFVFQSKNKNKAKEVTSFVGSRLVTLLMDMGLMFIGVTWLKISDKLVKLASQVIVIISNYIFSKLFVFNNKKVQKKNDIKYLHILIFLALIFLPILDLLNLYILNDIMTWINIIYKSLVVLSVVISLWIQKKHRVFLTILFSYALLQILYIYCNELNLLEEGTVLLDILCFPLFALYFYNHKNKYKNTNFTTKLFFFFAILFFIPLGLELGINKTFQYYSLKNEITAILLCLLPFTLKALHEAHNYITKTLGFLVIAGTICFWNSLALAYGFIVTAFYIVWEERNNLKERKIIVTLILAIGMSMCLYTSKDIYIKIGQNSFQSIENLLLDDRTKNIETVKKSFQHANIEEQLFGIFSIKELNLSKTKMDLSDIFYSLGYIGFVFYLIFMGYTFYNIKLGPYPKISFGLAIIASFFMGSVFTSFSVSMILGLICYQNGSEKKKRILLVSNMYPSKKFKHYGSFVKNTKNSLENLGFQVDNVVMKKHQNKILKVIAYLYFYHKAFLKSIFQSYDYIYVHFISHSTYPVILGRMTSVKTKLICNAHGNDIVPDYEWEQINVQRSKQTLKYADLCVAPSSYFKEVLEKDYQIKKDKIFVYPSGGVDLDTFIKKDKLECKKILGLEEHTTYYGFVSRLEKDKGWDTLLKAISILKKEMIAKNIKVFIIGTGKEQEQFIKLMKKYNLQDILIQKEFVSQKDLVIYYNAMDVLLFPTKRKSESLGLVGLEAMACKTFVIACDLYGPKEYAKNKENSLTFGEDQNGEKLANKIKEYWKLSTKEKNRILENAYQTAKKYDKKLLEEKLKEIFN